MSHVAVERFYGKLAVKARRGDAEAKLAKKLQGLFSRARVEAVARIKLGRLGTLDRKFAVAQLESSLGTAAGLIHQSVIEAAEGAPIPPELLREQAFTASRATLERVRGDVMETMAQAWTKGLGIDAAAALVEEAFIGLETYEAARIARTEINSAQSNSRMAKMKAAGVSYIQWWSANDTRTRDSHLEVHGQITAMGQPFSNGLKHPHDRSGPIEEWINCRCRPVPFRMPEGKAPPVWAGKSLAALKYFYEKDLVDVDTSKFTTSQEWYEHEKELKKRERALVKLAKSKQPINRVPKKKKVIPKDQHTVSSVEYLESLSPKDRLLLENTLDEWQWSATRLRNMDLKGKGDDSYNALRKAVAKSTKPMNTELYRGLKLSDAEVGKLKPGSKISMKAMSSFTKDRELAESFGSVLIETKAGVPGLDLAALDVAGLNIRAEEGLEVIVRKGRALIVESVEVIEGITKVTVR